MPRAPDLSAIPAGTSKLTCYLRNLEMATVQTGALLDAVRWAAGQPQGSLSEDVKTLLRPVVNVLGLAYGGANVRDVYRSTFVRRQIDSSGLV
jgi:hypothetical protein